MTHAVFVPQAAAQSQRARTPGSPIPSAERHRRLTSLLGNAQALKGAFASEGVRLKLLVCLGSFRLVASGASPDWGLVVGPGLRRVQC